MKADRHNNIRASYFSRLLVGLHSCPASSVGIEIWFSTVGFIWSKTRNRLGVEKAQKLATLYRALQPLPVRRLVLGRDQGADNAGAVGGDDGDDLNNDEEWNLRLHQILHHH